MMSVADIVRGARRREPEAAAPPPRNLRREYVDAVAAFVHAKQAGTAYAAVAAAQRLRELRAEAAAEGHGEAMERVWVEPQPHADDRWLQWFQARVEHLLHGGPDPGQRPWQSNEWPYWSERYAAAIRAVADAYRSGNPTARDEALGQLWQTRVRAIRAGFGERDAHLMGGPDAGVTPDAWEAEALFRLEHGRPSGMYRIPPAPRFYVSLAEQQARDATRHSEIILLEPWEGHDVGDRLYLPANVSHDLCEARKAAWCMDRPKPPDTRPPLELEPGEDWVRVRFLKLTRLTMRHMMNAGDVRVIAPDEAASLVRIGAAEEYVEPAPPPPPKPVVLFE